MGSHGVDNVFRVNLACFKMIKTVLIIGAVIACINAEEYTASRSFNVKVGKTKKTANCDFTISYTGDTASKPDSSVKCSVNWPKKNKPASTVKTVIDTVNSVPITDDGSFGPATLWCPQEDLLIYGSGAYDSVVNEAAADDWQQCAQRCAELTNDGGNKPCFSWTFNSNDDGVLGLDGKVCRLLAHMDVSSISADGVQSGYHKCWNAYLTSEAP